MPTPVRVVVVRGHQATPWELQQWAGLPDRFDVRFLRTGSNMVAADELPLRATPVRALRDLLPKGPLGEVLAGVAGDRYLGLARHLEGADVVHAEELHFWFAAQVARLRERPGCRYRLVQTVWETLPLVDAFRNRHARVFRRQVLRSTDLFLAATERARDALLLEGVEPERVEVCPPGIDLERFRTARSPTAPPDEHVVISPGRLVWEKGHHDVLRAVAALHRGLVKGPGDETLRPRLLLVGGGPEEGRLRAHARELGIGAAVELRRVPHAGMPDLYASASCLVLASLPTAASAYHLFDVPRTFWEEQFGMVLAEAMAAGLPLVVSRSGAIPEVVGDGGDYFAPGDWMELARLLAAGPLSRPPGTRVEHSPERLARFSAPAAAKRLAAVYDRLVADAPRG